MRADRHRGLGGWRRGLRRAWRRAVDSFVPDAVREQGPDSLRRARIVVGFSFALVLLALEGLAFVQLAFPARAAEPTELALTVGLAMSLGAPIALRRLQSVKVASNLLVGNAYLVVVTLLAVFGGLRAPVLHWCALVPMLAALLGARRSAVVWVGIVTGTVGLFAALDLSGHSIEPLVDLARIDPRLFWLQQLIDVGSWLAMLVAVALVYERHKAQQTAELGTTNAELTREIAQRRKAEQRTRYLAYYDELTSLPNRQFFKEQLELAMRRADRDGRMAAVMFLDLDGFKHVNDTYGHRFGDALLQQVAERLRSCVRNADAVFRGNPSDAEPVVSRLGGDEFTVLLVSLRDSREVKIVARRILRSFDEPFDLEGREVYMTVSIGIALYPSLVQDVAELLKNADLAMYHAKERGKNNFQLFNEAMNEDVVRRTVLAGDLRRAIADEELELHYQPIVRTSGGEVVALEALLRWRHRERGLLYPDEFIDVAEESGLILPISAWVLDRACRFVKELETEGFGCLRIAVNISGVQLRQQTLAAVVEGALIGAALDPARLELEITENVMMEDEEEAGRALDALKKIGVRVALDDFGTGYSSLAYLKRFPVDALKIDRSFVQEIDTDPQAQAIATAIVALAHSQRLQVVAEGVETARQEEFLARHGCDELQGYRFGPPVAASEVCVRLRRVPSQRVRPL